MATAVIGLTVFIVWLFHEFGVPLHSFGEEAAAAVGAAFLAWLLLQAFTNTATGGLVRRVHDIGVSAHGPSRPIILMFINRHLGRLDDQIKKMLTKEGALLDIDEVSFWTESCFQFASGEYDGTDSHVPSEYLKLYPRYLQAHAELRARRAAQNGDSRTLIGPDGAFRDDYVNAYDFGYKEFLDWHLRHSVPLLHLDRAGAERAYAQAAEGCEGDPIPTLDMGLWRGNYALLFREEVPGAKVRVWMAVPGRPWYSQIERFADVLAGRGDETGIAERLADAIPEIFERELCLRWESLVAPERRMERLAPFLTTVLAGRNRAHVLDAAAGIGVEALWLAEREFEVTVNEIEPVYQEIITERFADAGRDLRLFEQDWRSLHEKFGPSFDVVLVLGNSLCLLTDPKEQLRAVEEFARVLRPGGILIVDERNFARFTTEDVWSQIVLNPVLNFPYSGQIMYCGESVKGVPKSRDGRVVEFRYFQDDAGFDRRARAEPELSDELKRDLDAREIGTLDLYAFEPGDLVKLLRGAGFEEITGYPDLDLGSGQTVNGTMDGAETADFFTYVAAKST